jgi:hypothetical protein
MRVREETMRERERKLKGENEIFVKFIVQSD